MAKIGINLRATSGFVTDSVDQTYSLGEAYPTTRGGWTFGGVNAAGAGTPIISNIRDRSTSATYAPELAGVNFTGNNSGLRLRVDLPAAGAYLVGIALGDVSSAGNQYCQVYDDSTLLLTISGVATTAGNFADVAGTVRTPAQWKAERTTTPLTFASTILRVVWGGLAVTGSSQTGNATLAHVYVEQAASGGSAALASVATLAASGTATSSGSAAPASVATLSASGTATATGSASLASVATLSASGTATAAGSAALASTSDLAASGTASALGSAALASAATLAAAGSGAASGSAALGSVATLAAAGSGASSGFAAAINFRSTSAYVADGSGQTYSLGEVYPVTRAGLTFGWDADDTGQARNRVTTNDPRLCGILFASTAGSTVRTFRLDLPAPGQYDIRLALGDAAGGFTQYNVQVLDGSTPLLTIAAPTSNTNSFYDAGYQPGDTNWSAAAWPGSNRAVRLTFAGTVLTCKIGKTGTSGSDTSLAHLSVVQVAGPVAGSASLASVATLSASGTATASGSASLASVATLAAAGTSRASGAAALASATTLAASGTGASSGAAALASASTLAAAGSASAAGSSSLASIATLAAAGTASGGPAGLPPDLLAAVVAAWAAAGLDVAVGPIFPTRSDSATTFPRVVLTVASTPTVRSSSSSKVHDARLRFRCLARDEATVDAMVVTTRDALDGVALDSAAGGCLPLFPIGWQTVPDSRPGPGGPIWMYDQDFSARVLKPNPSP